MSFKGSYKKLQEDVNKFTRTEKIDAIFPVVLAAIVANVAQIIGYNPLSVILIIFGLGWSTSNLFVTLSYKLSKKALNQTDEILNEWKFVVKELTNCQVNLEQARKDKIIIAAFPGSKQ